MKQEVIESSKSTRMPENEKDRQRFRREREQSTRFLGNYFNPNLYEKSFVPGGEYIIKKKYSYSQIGLSYNFEKNDVLQKLPVVDPKVSSKSIQTYIEYDYIQENEFLITIEYCANCSEHSTYTSHSAELYKNFAIYIQKCIIIRFPFIKVLLKPIDTNIDMDQNSSYKILKQTKIIDNKYKEVRTGAMEVQLCFRTNKSKENNVVLLHSKLNSGIWPSITNVLNQLVAHMPLFKCDIKLFDKENYENENQKSEDENLNDVALNDKLLNIKLNVYKLRSQVSEDLCNAAKEELDKLNDPKKRKFFMQRSRLDDKESFYNLGSTLIYNDFLHTKNGETVARPISSTLSNFFVDKKSTRVNTANRVSDFRIGTSKDFSKSQNTDDQIEIINKDIISKSKGDLVRTLYSLSNGLVYLDDLPYDTYLIEVEESSNYQTYAIILNFKNIFIDKCIHKFIGLRKQLSAYLKLFVYSLNKNTSAEQLVSGADVVINFMSSTKDKIFFDEQENKLKLNESSNVKGRYECKVTPGKYTLEINKKGYGKIKKQVELNSGDNKINVEIGKKTINSLKVTVYTHDKFLPIENASVKLFLGNTDMILDCVTNSDGNCEFEDSLNEDCITIFVEKYGFYSTQRSYFVGDSAVSNEVVCIMVKESFVMNENCILIITYSNLYDDNFEPVFQFSNSIGGYTDISCSDSQTENGVLISFFKYHHLQKDEKEELKQDDDELEEIIRITLKIKSKKLKKYFKIDENTIMNGLQRNSCECSVYTPNNIFYIQSPTFSKDKNYDYWDIGFLDIRNNLFYELGNLLELTCERIQHFYDWINFLQIIIDHKIYTKLFEIFEFDKGQFLNNDRFIHEPTFLASLRNITKNEFNSEFIIFLCDIAKIQNKLISYVVLKKKISSNLKNFRDNLKFTF